MINRMDWLNHYDVINFIPDLIDLGTKRCKMGLQEGMVMPMQYIMSVQQLWEKIKIWTDIKWNTLNGNWSIIPRLLIDDDDETRLILSELGWKASELATDTETKPPSGLKRDPGESIFSLSRDAIRLIPMMGDMLLSDGKGKVNIKWVKLQRLLRT